MTFTNDEIREANRNVVDALAACGIPNPNKDLMALEPEDKVVGAQVRAFLNELRKLGFKEKKHYQGDDDFTPQRSLNKAETQVYFAMSGTGYQFPTITQIWYGYPTSPAPNLF